MRAIGALILLAALSDPLPQSSEGFWRSEGYGLLVQIQGTRMTTFQTTSISCVRWWTARRLDTTDTPGETVFKRSDADIRLTRGPSPDALLMREGPMISSVTLKRISGQPEQCKAQFEDTPQNNYSIFWQTFAEQFALFPTYRIDWNSVDRKYRSRVTTATSPQELFAILRAMILPFHNAHTNIIATSIGRQYLGYRPASAIGRRLQSADSVPIQQVLDLFKDQAQRSKAIIETRYSIESLRPFANDMIHFGLLRDSIGYLRVGAFEGYAKEGRFERDAPRSKWLSTRSSPVLSG